MTHAKKKLSNQSHSL